MYIAVTAPDSDALLIAATHGFDLLPALASSSAAQSWPALIISPGNYLEPERASSPPFVRYTVLLN